MSWWDTSGFTNLATQAFKNAQKTIDKVLDIDEETEKKSGKSKRKDSKPPVKSTKEKPKTNAGSDGDFWSMWSNPDESTDKDKESEPQLSSGSSWSLPWGISPDSDRKKGREEKIKKGFQDVDLVSPHKTSSLQSDDKDHTLNQDVPEKSEDVLEFQYSNIMPETSQELPGQETTHFMKETSVIEKIEPLDTSQENEDGQGESIHTTCLEVADPSGDSSGWDITDSVIKLVEMDDQFYTEESIDQSVNEKDLINKNDSVLDHSVKNRETSLEMDMSSKSMSFPAPPSKDHKDDLELEVPYDVYDDENIQIKSDVNFQVTPCESEQISSDSVGEQSHKVEEFEKEKEITAPSTEVSEPETVIENILLTENSSVCNVVNSSQENVQINTSETFDPSSSGRSDEYQQNENATTEEDSKMQNDPMQSYVDIQNIDSSMNSSDFSQPSVDAEITQTSSDLDVHVSISSSTGSSEVGRLDSSADTIVNKTVIEGEMEDVKDRPYSLFSSEKMNENNDQADLSKSISPASSYVKCMIEEAMEESGKEDSGSDNHSSGGKSESSKVDSELEKSVYSGHESSDDIETTTSSDIEIISVPLLSSSDKQYCLPYDMPALKINLQPRHSGAEGKGHQRSDSQSSSSTQSKGGDNERLSPDRGDCHGWADEELHHPDLEAVQEEGADSPYHPERLLKLAKVVVSQISGGQKLAEMAEVLQARETKLVQMSKDNHQLMEDNSILRCQLQQSEEAREAETADLKALTDEFTVRIGESEKKLQAVLREKESLRSQLTSVETELEKRSQGSDLEALLEEKTEQVNELMAEGEKLSKQQLQSNNIIKKLRAKEKETDATLTSQKKKIEEQTKELEKLKAVLDSKEQMETKQSDAINQLNSAVQRQEKEYNKVKSDFEDAQEKNRGLQTALDNAYKEIAELHRSNASQDSKAQEAALSVETSVREELRITMEREQMRFKQEREAFIMQVDDLRLDMARLEKEHERREDLLREEITHLQERLQQDEARSQDLSQSVTTATRPLLRQIENLQATFGAQSRAWEKVEKNLTDRLAEGQRALALAQEKERAATDNYVEASAKLASLEMTNSRLKQEKSSLIAEKEGDHGRLEELQDAKNSLSAQIETIRQNLNQEIKQLKMEKVQLESQLTLERSKLESEKKKCSSLEEQLSMAHTERPMSRGTPSPSPSMSISRQESLAGSIHEYSAFGMKLPYEDVTDSSSAFMGTPKSSVYENLRQGGATIVVENLQSQLKQKEGEIVQLQSEISQLERTRESMARELVNLTNQNEELQESKDAYKMLEEQFQELNNRYSAILLMYGEKEEQVQELRLDLQDVKEMYKTQIDALLAK